MKGPGCARFQHAFNLGRASIECSYSDSVRMIPVHHRRTCSCYVLLFLLFSPIATRCYLTIAHVLLLSVHDST